jgi:hypothetical protein
MVKVGNFLNVCAIHVILGQSLLGFCPSLNDVALCFVRQIMASPEQLCTMSAKVNNR